MIRIVDCALESPLGLLRARGMRRDPALEIVVAEIIEDVRVRGDEALLDNARKFDAPGIEGLRVSDEEFEGAHLGEQERKALKDAYERILQFHLRQFEVFASGLSAPDAGGARTWQVWPEVTLGQRIAPLQTVGLCVPGGRAAYPSSVLMLAGPARAAGVERLVCITPARDDGTLHTGVLEALKLTGVRDAFKVGGAAAIASMAFGTQSVPRVDKIVGPGNRFVNEAKRQLWGQVGLDGYAGPSEVCVLADDSANPRFAAADLLTQVEHAPDNAAFLITMSREKLDDVLAEVAAQLEGAPRADVMRAALANESLAIIARDLNEACDLVNEIAPEHLTLAVADPSDYLPKIRNAGCILAGEWTPESVADYCLGPSHTLPTGGAARFSGPVNVLDFLKIQSYASLTREDLAPLLGIAETLGALEGFAAHARGASIRRS